MSGPKLYKFPMNSHEEAAGTYARLAAFGRGVRVRVVNNELEFSVTQEAWLEGATSSRIREEIEKAKAELSRSEELKRVLNENINREREHIKSKRSELYRAFSDSKERLGRELSECAAVKKRAERKISTPFGEYGLNEERAAAEKLEGDIRSRLGALNAEYEKAVAECGRQEKKLDGCAALSDINGISRSVAGICFSGFRSDGGVQRLSARVTEKTATLERFIGFLGELYNAMKDKELSGHFDRIRREVADIDVFDPSARDRLMSVLGTIEGEIKALRGREALRSAEDKERADISERMEALAALRKALVPVTEGLKGNSEVRADYAPLSAKLSDGCDGVIADISSFDFMSGKNAGRLDGIKKRLAVIRFSGMSERSAAELSSLLNELHELRVSCEKENDIYLRFKSAQEEYVGHYMRLRGALSVEGSEAEEGALDRIIDPTELFMRASDPEGQIAELEALNAELAQKTGALLRDSMCDAFSAAVAARAGSSVFKKEIKDDGGHVYFTRKDHPGVIFDAVCGTDGGAMVYPRGVTLYNGVHLISPEELKKLHDSCGWADDVSDMFARFGMEGGGYSEADSGEREKLYSYDGYYRIGSYEESERYLRKSDFSEERMAAMLGKERDDGVSETSRDNRRAAAKRAAKRD